MKKQFFAIILSVFFVNALFSAPVITAGITFNEFETAFNNDKVWYAQLQAGSTGTTGTNTHEFEFGNSDGTFLTNEPLYTEDVSWVNGSNNSFTISVDQFNNLSVSAGGSTTTSGSEYQILNPFNEIWVGLLLASGDDRDDMSVNSHQYDTQSINDLSVVGGNGPQTFAAFKFYDDQETDNIAKFTIDGSLLIDTVAKRSAEQWSYTVFAVNNTAIPEPSVYVFILGIIALSATLTRRRFR